MQLHWLRDRGRKRRFGERGAAAVEAAIVTPIVMAMLFGIIELGLLFKDYLAAVGAVRSGVRIAAATPRNSTFAQSAANQVAKTGSAINFKDVQQLWIYRAGDTTDTPDGFSDFSNCTVCVKFAWDVGTSKFIMTSDTWPAITQNACSSSSAQGPPDRIGVYLKLRHDAFTGLVFNTIYLSEASIMSLEPISFQLACL